MKYKTLEKEVDLLLTTFTKEKPEFTSCLTEPGLKFQKEFSELVGLVRKTYSIPVVFQIFNTTLIDFYDKISENYKEELEEEFEVKSTKESSKFEKSRFKLKELIDKIGISNFFQKIEYELPIYLEALNSYYILALFAYIDYYLSSIYEIIITTYSNEKIKKLLLKIEPRRNIDWQLNLLNDNLKLAVSKSKLKELLKETSWQKTYKNLIKFRNILAHEEPKVKQKILFEKFPNLLIKAEELTKKDFESDKQKNTDVDFVDLDKLQEILEPTIKTMFLLIEIGKECYGYISIIDILINDFLKS